MKHNNKVKFLAVLMFLQTVFGWSKEQYARVLRLIDSTNSDGNTFTQVLLDRFENGETGAPDTSLGLPRTNSYWLTMFVKEYCAPGVIISFDDAKMTQGNGLKLFLLDALISISGKNVLDLFPELGNYFEAASAKRRAEQLKR